MCEIINWELCKYLRSDYIRRYDTLNQNVFFLLIKDKILRNFKIWTGYIIKFEQQTFLKGKYQTVDFEVPEYLRERLEENPDQCGSYGGLKK